MLLIFGGDPTIANKNGFTSLHIAARNGHADIVNLLINKGSLMGYLKKSKTRNGSEYSR